MDQPDRIPGRGKLDGMEMNRRQLLQGAAAATVLSTVTFPAGSLQGSSPPVDGSKIRQSIAHWCFSEHWKVEQTIDHAVDLGCQSVELIDPKYFPLLQKRGLVCAIGQIDMAPDPPFVKGWNNPQHHDQLLKATKDSIDACSEFGYPNVIAFTGMNDGLSKEEGSRNCVEGFKKIVRHAQKKNVTLCLEVLNTRDDTHPMKGHPGYMGDDTEYVVDIIRKVDSPNLKLLFDVYHIQIMNGDVIRRLRQYKDLLGHVHVAGNPGRNEIGAGQEIYYKAVMEALVEMGYEGYVGQEFLPTGDPLASLTEAVKICNI
ncbi:MAG: TIM barrel protein [Planctomycetota bacterium]|nr:TIM barrel protein [Planctomycetota bacterium]